MGDFIANLGVAFPGFFLLIGSAAGLMYAVLLAWWTWGPIGGIPAAIAAVSFVFAFFYASSEV